MHVEHYWFISWITSIFFLWYLQPHWEQDFRWGSVCIGQSFASEPESSEAVVSPTARVLRMFMYWDLLVWACSLDHKHSWLMMMDLMKTLHVWQCKNCKSVYQLTLCYLVLTISHTLNIFMKSPLSHLGFFWYSAVLTTTISQLMVCVH